VSGPETSRLATLCLWVAGALLGVAFVFQVATDRFLFADGANFFLGMLQKRGFSSWDPSRQWAQDLTQAAPVALMKLSVRDVALLATAYGASLFATPLWALGGCVWFTPRAERVHLLPVAGALAFLALDSSLYVISESNVAAGCFFVLSAFLLFADRHGDRPARLLVAAGLALLDTRIYESNVVLGPVLAALAVMQLRRRPPRALAVTLVWIGLCALASAGLAIYWMYEGARTAGSLVNHETLAQLLHSATAVGSAALFGLFLAATLFPARTRGALALGLAGAALGLGLGLLPALDVHRADVDLAMTARAFNVLVPPVVAAAILLRRRLRAAAPPSRWALAPLLALLCWNGAWQASVSLRWLEHTGQLLDAVDASPRPQIPLRQTAAARSPFSPPQFAWALPSLSIALQAIRGDTVRALVISDFKPPFIPFDPYRVDAWPRLGEYGVLNEPRDLTTAPR
jgi:hypothetical protein